MNVLEGHFPIEKAGIINVSEGPTTTCASCPADERPPKPCGVVTASGGQGVTRTRHALGSTPGLVRITYDMYSIPDRLDCFYQGVLVASTDGLVSGSGSLEWTYAPRVGDPVWCLVVVSAPIGGTGWAYTIHCPD
ncbi:MAG: hypothetical protein L6R48_07370 [Planctomycetes bacterium]|nr:hypothetical protein [Planctomycetota bacterium]